MKILVYSFCLASVSFLCHASLKRKNFIGNGDNHFIQHFESEFFNWRPVDRSVEGIEKLTTSLLHDIYSRAGKGFNIIISPISIWTILAMLLEGASGKTEKEIRTKLNLLYGSHDESRQIVRTRYNELKKYLRGGNSPTEFTSLNFLIADKMKLINPEYKNKIRDFYQGISFQVGIKDRQRLVSVINNWAKDSSRNKIETIVSPDMLDNLVFMIGNAVYFKSKWKHPFDPAQTVVMPFRDENGRGIKNVLMMNQILMLPYTYNTLLDCQIVEIPYFDDATSMVVILPHEGVKLNTVFSKMRYLSLDQIVPKNATEELIQLSIPRFHVDSNMYLHEILKQDLPSVFSREFAEFPGIAKDIYVSKVSHKAEIENNEEGTTASAVTTVQFAYKSSGVTFQANHPFIYFIVDRRSRNILFAGTFSNPFTNLQ